jgi:FkbM family methyltransferase
MEAALCHGLWVPKSDEKVFARYAEFEGLPDLDVSKVAKCAALSGSFGVALDIGAHVGAVAVYLARKFERVIAFEAVPSTFEFLRRNTKALGNVTAIHTAVGQVVGDTYFLHYPHHGQLSHVAGSMAEAKTERIGPIAASTIDSLNLEGVSFMKIDVEGFELPVLLGAITTLDRCRPLVLVEQAGNDEKHFGRPRNEASQLLEELGMRLHPDAPKMKNDRLYTF